MFKSLFRNKNGKKANKDVEELAMSKGLPEEDEFQFDLSADLDERVAEQRSSWQFDTLDPGYLSMMKDVLITSKKNAGLPPSYFETTEFASDLTEQQHRRVDRFSACLVPWINRVMDLKGARVAEIGSGTGSSTLAFAPLVSEIKCYEIDATATEIAKKRLGYWNIENVHWTNELFLRDSSSLQGDTEFDLILMVAVLEHLHFEEFKDILRLAMDKLAPNGVILVAETPNRLSILDYHTSWLPFFQWLPMELALEYHGQSPREWLRTDWSSQIELHGDDPASLKEKVVRWGNGVSFHDFEIALGADVHDRILLDGWEPEVRPLAPVFYDDRFLTKTFKDFDISAHRAFARSWLYLAIGK